MWSAVTIERPIEEVFEFVSTPENDPTWIPASLRLLSKATRQPALPLLRLLRKPTEPYGDENHDHRHDIGLEDLRHEVPASGKTAAKSSCIAVFHATRAATSPKAAVISSTSLSSTSLLTVSPSHSWTGAS